MRVIVLKKNRTNKRGTPVTRDIPLKKPLTKKELFVSKVETGPPYIERKYSIAATPSMKTKWLKAIKSLKPTSGSAAQTDSRRNGGENRPSTSQTWRASDDGGHHLQEYTYKKITACDVCSQILRGHTRQGLRCRICKLNAHGDCAAQLPRCQPKQKLLRRQKSTSEIENRSEFDEDDYTDRTERLPTTGAVGSASVSTGPAGSCAAPTTSATSRIGRGIRPPPVPMPILGVQLQQQELQRSGLGGGGIPSISTGVLPVPSQDLSSSSVPHSPRKQKLNTYMKSLSLDSPESSELCKLMRNRQKTQRLNQASSATLAENYPSSGSGNIVDVSGSNRNTINSNYNYRQNYNDCVDALEASTAPTNVKSRLHSPSSPSHHGQKVNVHTKRGAFVGSGSGSVDVPDDKSLSSASASPCPSPIKQQISHRLLPANLYVVLYNFKARHADELDLKAGNKISVIDTLDGDWWKGKANGRIGYFPSKYCMRLNSNEKPLQLTHNLQLPDNEFGENINLLRGQIVVQLDGKANGVVLVRTADNRHCYCPVKYLQEV